MKRFSGAESRTAEFPVLILKTPRTPQHYGGVSSVVREDIYPPISLYITLTLSTYESIQEHKAEF